MKTFNHYIVYLVCFAVISGLSLTGCSDLQFDNFEEDTVSKPGKSEFILDKLPPSRNKLKDIFLSTDPKERFAGDISHYVYEVRLGPGPYDVVRIHRVVRERRPRHPVRTEGGVFMVHGSLQDFGDIYLYAGVDNPSPQTTIPLYLAANGIDVWGLDLAWTLIPGETTDFSFMKDWDVDREVDHILAAMSVARYFRVLSEQGFGRLNLLGFSYSVGLAYIAAAREAQQPLHQRDIGGLVPVDAGLIAKDETRRQLACNNATAGRNQINNGNFIRTTQILRVIGHLAKTAPNEPSPLPPFSGFTNFQAALLLSVSPPFWNFAGVDFNEDDVPVDLLYSDPDRWINLLIGAPPNTAFMPLLATVQMDEIRCGEKDVSLEVNLPEITVPILYIGAGGGLGEEEGRWTTEETSSKDITIFEVSLQPESKRNIDFGHADLFIADNAAELMWEKLRSWLADHNNPALNPYNKHQVLN